MKNKFVNMEHEIIFKKMTGTFGSCFDKHENKDNNTRPFIRVPDSVTDNIKMLQQTANNSARRPITSHRKFIGRFIVFFKKVTRKLLKWYINPITEQQTKFNNAIPPIIGELSEVINNNVNRIDDNISRINEINDRFNSTNSRLGSTNDRLDSTNDKLDNEITRLEKQYTKKIIELEELMQGIKEMEFKNRTNIENLAAELKADINSWHKTTYSQTGEDAILYHIFDVLKIPFNQIVYIDLGANHAKLISNTYFFYERGARGVLVEANPKLIKELTFNRHKDIVLNNLVSTTDEEEADFYILSGDGLSTPDKKDIDDIIKINPTISLEGKERIKTISVNTIIEKYLMGVAPTFISLDIEGYTFEILKSIDLDKYRPICLIVETIEYRPYLDINLKVNDYTEYLSTKDYVEFAFTGINSIFIDKRYLEKRNEAKL